MFRAASGLKDIGKIVNKSRLHMGAKAPDFKLPGVDGKSYTLEQFSGRQIVAVIFTCNHCPYAQAYEDRLIQIQKDFSDQRVALIAINANESQNYPEDDFPKMVIRSKEKGFNFPYLRDETQSVADAYGAHYTPEIFLLDQERRLQYTGRIDDHWQDAEAVQTHDLRDAIIALLSGEKVKNAETHAIGCTIKWARI